MMINNGARLCAFLFAATLTVGCSSGSATSNAASDAPSYPAWASAAVPDYPNALDQSLARDDFYQIDSADDSATVLAWYKSHVAGAWGTAGTPSNMVLPNANGVRIEIDKLGYGNEPVGKRPRTMICLNRIVDGQAPSC